MASFKLKSINQFNKWEMTAVLLIAIFILFPVRVPGWMNSPVAYVVFLAAAVSLFVYANPVLGVLFLFVIYEIMRRSNAYDFKPADLTHRQYSEPMSSQPAPLSETEPILPELEKTLEEDFVNTLAPIGHSETPKYDDDSVKPVSSSVGNASLF
jgi:hypothetical protein